MQDLLNGVIKFQQEVYPKKKALFARLAGKQSPRALFITAAFRAADLGKKVVLIERYATLGGVCLNVGFGNHFCGM